MPNVKIELGGARYDVADTSAPVLAVAFDKLTDEHAAAIARADLADTAVETANGERDTVQGKLDAIEKDKPDAEAVEAARLDWYNERERLLGFARKAKVEKCDELTNDALRLAVVKSKLPETRDDVSVEYLTGVLASFESLPAPRHDSLDTVARRAANLDRDGNPATPDDYDARMDAANASYVAGHCGQRKPAEAAN